MAEELIADKSQALSRLFPGRRLQGYVRGKLRSDPLYAGVWEELKGSDAPLLDIGCGMGVFAFLLRSLGFEAPILGLDYDAGKIKLGKEIAQREEIKEVVFRKFDARQDVLEHEGNVVILDILQFFTAEERRALLRQAVGCLPEGGKLVLRNTMQAEGWRFRWTKLGDYLAKWSFWMKDFPVSYPSLEELDRLFSELGCEVRSRPLWGKTPFNNYLVVVTKPQL